MELYQYSLPVFLLAIFLLILGLKMINYNIGYARCQEWINSTNPESGIYINNGMAYCKKTNEIKSCCSPSSYGVQAFRPWKWLP